MKTNRSQQVFITKLAVFIGTLVLTILSLLLNLGIINKPIVKDADLDGYDAVQYGGDDCNDSDSNINPSAIDIPDDGVDQNCDGKDASLANLQPNEDYDSDGSIVDQDCNDFDSNIHPGATEIFDLKDNNCDGSVDEGFQSITLYDNFAISSYSPETIVATSRKVKTIGKIADAYLYVEASVEKPESKLTKFDTIYVYLDRGEDGGLLRRDLSEVQSGASDTTTKLTFSLNKIPLTSLPYREVGEPRIVNYLDVLNQQGVHRIGAFVGSERGGVLKKMIIGYKGGSLMIDK